MSKPQQRGYKTCTLHPSLWGSQRAVRGKHQFRLRAHLVRRGDSHPSGKRTRISFVIGLVAPKRHDLVSLAPLPSLPPARPHFHPLPCLSQTSRFVTGTGSLEPARLGGEQYGAQCPNRAVTSLHQSNVTPYTSSTYGRKKAASMPRNTSTKPIARDCISVRLPTLRTGGTSTATVNPTTNSRLGIHGPVGSAPDCIASKPRLPMNNAMPTMRANRPE